MDALVDTSPNAESTSSYEGRYYWWDKIRSDVRRYCRACLVCASRIDQGCALKPQLQPILIDGPFHRVGVDVLQLPLTYENNQHAIVFMDYLN